MVVQMVRGAVHITRSFLQMCFHI